MGVLNIRLSIDSDLEQVQLIGMAVNKICAGAKFDAMTANQLELSVVEAVNNCIEHAYELQPGHEVTVTIEIDDDGATFIIEDTGKAMPEGTMDAMDFDPEDVDAVPEGGMGLFIMTYIMDDVRYESAQGRNFLTMRRNFEPNTQNPKP